MRPVKDGVLVPLSIKDLKCCVCKQDIPILNGIAFISSVDFIEGDKLYSVCEEGRAPCLDIFKLCPIIYEGKTISKFLMRKL